MASRHKRRWESGVRQFLAMTALQLVTHLAGGGGWSRIQQPWDVIELFLDDAPVSLAISSAGGPATQPCDSGLGDSLKTSAAQEQLFEDIGSWKPRLIVANLPDWTPEASEPARELVLRQREGGRDVLLWYSVNTTMPLPPSHLEVGLLLVYGSLDGRAADASFLHGRHDFGGLQRRQSWLVD